MSESVVEMCHCGKPLHYTDSAIEAMVRFLIGIHGPTVRVQLVSGESYAVPRHYIALHGLKGAELADLATRYDWQPVSES